MEPTIIVLLILALVVLVFVAVKQVKDAPDKAELERLRAGVADQDRARAELEQRTREARELLVTKTTLETQLAPEREKVALLLAAEAQLRSEIKDLNAEKLTKSNELVAAGADLRAARQELAAKEKLYAEQLGAAKKAQDQAITDEAQLRSEIGALNAEKLTKSNELATAEADLRAARQELAAREKLYADQLETAKKAQDKAIADLREAFKALSAEALSKNNPEFLRLAQENFRILQKAAEGNLQERQAKIEGLLKPLEAQLKVYQTHLQQSGEAQSKSLGEVTKHLEALTQQSQSLAGETERLRTVLKSSQTRGRWGEETLHRVVEAAGMSTHCDFTEQEQKDDKRPDLVVKLPGDREIVVDAKVPALDSIAALETADLEKRGRLVQEHATALKNTIKDLAKKNYTAQFPKALDCVVLFVPAESLFSVALEGDPGLLTWAAREYRILLATPASLIALLRAVSVSWQQFTQTENVQAMAEAAQELYVRVATFTKHLGGIRDGLAKANEAFNEAVGSYRSRVLPQGRELQLLGLPAGTKELADVEPIESVLRPAPDSEDKK